MKEKLLNSLNKNELSNILGVSVRTIDLWRKNKGMPHFNVGMYVKFDEKEVMEWLKEQNKQNGIEM